MTISKSALEREMKRVHPSPSEAQKAAGNYSKGHPKIHGMEISIETARGQSRSGVGPDGKPWKVDRMPHNYGYVRRTVGADDDQIDAYIGPHLKSPKVFVVDQIDADTGHFDEHKAFLGFSSKKQVENAYRKSFSDDRGNDRLGAITEMSVDEFKKWSKTHHTAFPMAEGVHTHNDEPKGYADGGSVRGNQSMIDDLGYADGGAVDDWVTPSGAEDDWVAPEMDKARAKLGAGLKSGKSGDADVYKTAAFRSNQGVPAANATDAAISGATMGWSDEAAAAATAPIDMAQRGESFSEAYNHNLAAERDRLDQYRKAHPIAAGLAEAAGSMALAPVKGAVQTIPTMIAAGAGIGGVSGAGYAEGDPLETAREAGKGAAFGAGLSAAIPAGAAIIKSAAAPFIRNITAAVNPEARAFDALRRDFARDGVDVAQLGQELTAAHAAGKPMSIADAGDRNVMGLARAVATGKGGGSQKINSMLENRRLDAPARIVDDLRLSLADPDHFYAGIEAIAKNRQAVAAPLYEAAYAKNLPRDNVSINAVLETPAGQRAMKAAQELAENEGIAFNPQSVRGVDLMKRSLDDMVETARRNGSMNEARVVGNLRNKMVSSVDALVPEYRAARQAWSSHTDLSDAIERGRQFLKPGLDKEAAVREIQAMTPAEKQIARIGMAREISSMFDQPQMALSKINKLLSSDRILAITQELFPSSAAFDKWRADLTREAMMLRRGQQIQGGSNTVNKLADVEDNSLSSAALDLIKGHPVRAAMNAMGGAGQRLAKGVNEKTANKLGEVFTTLDPAKQQEFLNQIATVLPPMQLNRLLATVGARAAPAISSRTE